MGIAIRIYTYIRMKYLRLFCVTEYFFSRCRYARNGRKISIEKKEEETERKS